MGTCQFKSKYTVRNNVLLPVIDRLKDIIHYILGGPICQGALSLAMSPPLPDLWLRHCSSLCKVDMFAVIWLPGCRSGEVKINILAWKRRNSSLHYPPSLSPEQSFTTLSLMGAGGSLNPVPSGRHSTSNPIATQYASWDSTHTGRVCTD